MSEGSRRAPMDASTIVSRQKLPALALPTFAVTVVSGRDAGARVTLDASTPGRLFVGKSEACQLRLTDPLVSRRHLALDLVDGTLRLSDLGSTNGTRVNGVHALEVTLHGGEIVVVGDTQLQVDATIPAAVEVPKTTAFGRLVGASPEMRRIYPLCARLAQADVPVLIEGETGTGKEVLAESLHLEGNRAAGPFVVCDCTAIPPNLLESALFGHERGAFTGATNQAKGFFEQAHGGTLLLDEIGDLDVSLQAKLLRAIERAEIRRVGGDRWLKVDVRILSATRRDLEKEIQAGRFRDDLFYRLAVARIELPPLRARRGDVAFLGQHLWSLLGGGKTPIPHDLVLRFEDYAWPGNVRELRNTIARRIALGDLSHLSTKHDAPPVAPSSPPPAEGGDVVDRVLELSLPLSDSRDLVVEDFERRYIERMLARHDGDATKAAAASGIARRYFQLLRTKRTR